MACDDRIRLQNYLYGERDAGFFGYSHFAGGFPGGQAEYVRVPLGEVNLLPIPDDVPDEKALYLSDVLPTSYHSIVDTGVEEGDTVAVWVRQTARWASAITYPFVRALDPSVSASHAGQNLREPVV